MDGGSDFVSVFKINGRPLLPPAMTPRRWKEMHEYKMKALAVERRLKEKKKGQRNSPGVSAHHDEDGNKENKETERIYAGNTDDSIFDGRYHTKVVLSERESFKEIPPFLQKSIDKNSTIVCDLPNYGDCQEEACSVAPTESTDLHPYLNSSLEDEMCSSEANCGAECGPSPKYAEDSTDCGTVEYYCNSEENMERSLVKDGPKCESTDLHVYSFSSEKATIIDTTRVVSHLDSQLTHDEIAAETNDLASPCRCSMICNEGEVEANAEDFTKYEAGCNYSSLPSSPLPSESILANESNAENGVTGIYNKTYALSDCFRLQSPPARLIRTGSFTLETPSPLLIANIEQFTIDAPKHSNCPSNAAESNMVCNQANNCADMITECISFENRRSLHLSSSENEVDKLESKRANARVVQKTRVASVDHSKREPMNGGNPRVTVFDRLAADAAKKAEERRKLNKKSNAEVFKIPKKVTKAASRRMRSSLSASNIRISLSGAHRSRSDTLASKRSNSEANVSSAHVKSAPSSFKKPNMLTQVVSKPLLRKPVVMNARTSMSHNVDPVVNIPEDMKPLLHVEKDSRSSDSLDKCTLAKPPTTHDILTSFPSSTNDVHEIEVNRTKRMIYSVQTSPISPPLPLKSNELAVTGRGDEMTALQGGGRQRRRWSVGWSGWVSSAVEQQPDSQPSDLEGCVSDGPLEPECEGLEVPVSELEHDLHDVCIHTSVGSITVPLHEVQKSQVSHENNDETELPSPDTVKSQEKMTNSETLIVENIISSSPQSSSCDLNDDSVQSFADDKMKESLVNTPKEASCIITHNVTPMSERNRGSSVLFTPLDNPSNDNSVSCGEIFVQPVKILPSLEKTLYLMPDSPVGTVGIKETALKLLGCLVEEQDKAMAKLLDDQRQQAEKMKEQFKVQQKCLVERVANLVTSLSTPQSRKSKMPHCHKHGEENIPAPEENVIISKTPPMCDQRLSVPPPLTPPTVSRIPIDSGNHLSPPPCSSQLELSSQLRLDDILVAKSSKDIVNELESQLIKFSQKEDLPLVENSCCQVCLSVQSNCRCSQEESNCSSTIREEITTLSVGSMDHTTFTASDGGVCDTECSKIKDKIVCSSSPFQDQNYCNLTHSSVKHEKNVSTSLSSVKTDSALQDGVLDLSEILDMETGRKCGNIRGQNSPCSIDKSKRNFEGMHSSPLLPASHSVKTKDANPAVSPKENLSLYRQIYEQDLKRLKSFESNAKKESKYIDGLSESDGGSSMKDNLKSPEKRTVTSDKLSSPQRKTDESERKEVQLDMLPDLRSDILRAYLGSQTPSTGPVFLQTPVPSVACPYQVRPTSSTPEELGTNSTVLILLPPKEVDCLKDGHSPASLDPVIQENLECQESLDLSPNELHLSIGSSSSSSMSLPHEPRQTFSESNPSATDSHSSEHYTMASSKCFGEDSSRLDNSMLLKFGKLSALIRGYLTRRLLKTEKVRRIKITIRDLMVTALKVHSEVSQEDEVNPNDVRLHGQILAELNATCEEFHRVFFEMTKSEQMAVISADRRSLLSSSGSIAVVDAVQVITPRPALLSAVTLKTLQRRFSMYSPKNGVEEAEKKSDGKQPTKKKMSSVGLGAGQRMTKNAKGRERTSARSTSRAFSISEDATSNSVSRNVKASNVPLTRRGHVPSKASKKKRRSASAGEINRKPWR